MKSWRCVMENSWTVHIGDEIEPIFTGDGQSIRMVAKMLSGENATDMQDHLQYLKNVIKITSPFDKVIVTSDTHEVEVYEVPEYVKKKATFSTDKISL